MGTNKTILLLTIVVATRGETATFVTSPSSESPGERLEVTSHTEVKLLEVKLLHETARAIETLGHAFPRPIRLVILVKTVK